jgi:hypothetical protein
MNSLVVQNLKFKNESLFTFIALLQYHQRSYHIYFLG